MTAEERLYVKCAALKNAAIDEAARIMVEEGSLAATHKSFRRPAAREEQAGMRKRGRR